MYTRIGPMWFPLDQKTSSFDELLVIGADCPPQSIVLIYQERLTPQRISIYSTCMILDEEI